MDAQQAELVAGVSLAVAQGKNGYSIGSFLAIKNFVCFYGSDLSFPNKE